MSDFASHEWTRHCRNISWVKSIFILLDLYTRKYLSTVLMWFDKVALHSWNILNGQAKTGASGVTAIYWTQGYWTTPYAGGSLWWTLTYEKTNLLHRHYTVCISPAVIGVHLCLYRDGNLTYTDGCYKLQHTLVSNIEHSVHSYFIDEKYCT